MKEIKLWSDVPEPDRVDREFLESCNGANPAHYFGSAGRTDPVEAAASWVAARLYPSPDGCPAAVRWGTSNRWHQCRAQVIPGSVFCHNHGGRLAPRVPEAQRFRERLDRQRSRLIERRREIDETLEELDRLALTLDQAGGLK